MLHPETARAAPAIAGSDPHKSSCLAADGSENALKTEITQTKIELNGSEPRSLFNGNHGSDQPTIVNLKRASELKPMPIAWVWPGWLAQGKLHIIGGQPGTGKTTLAMKIAAAVSTGGRLPDGSTATKGNVIIWSGEDDPADTLKPRLAASGADLNRVFFVQDVFGRERAAAVRSGQGHLALKTGHRCRWRRCPAYC